MKIEQRRLSAECGWRMCASSLHGEIPQLALVFGPRRLIEDAAVLARTRAAYPRTVLVVASGAGEFAGAGVSDDQLVVTAIAFEKSTFRTTALSVVDRAGSYAAGRELARQLLAPDLVHVLVLCDGLRVNGSRLVDGVNEGLPAGISVTGGLAGDGTDFGRTIVGVGTNIGPDRVVAIGFYGAHLHVGHGCSSGWQPYGPERVVTRAEDNILFELDGQPALELYREHLEGSSESLTAAALRHPLHMTPEGGGIAVVRTSHSIDEETGVMEFAGDIAEGARVRFLQASPEDLMAGADEAARQALSAGSRDLVLCVNCIARRVVLGERAPEEMARVREIIGSAPVLAGFYSYGEIAPAAGGTGAQFHNQTMTITSLRED